jgi:hypothetical protein
LGIKSISDEVLQLLEKAKCENRYDVTAYSYEIIACPKYSLKLGYKHSESKEDAEILKKLYTNYII